MPQPSRIALFVLLWLTANVSGATELRILAWNVESGDASERSPSNGNDPAVIAAELQELTGFDIVGLSEVGVENVARYVAALNAGNQAAEYLSVHSATGRDDRLVLAYNTRRLQLVQSYELHRYGDWQLNSPNDEGVWRFRSPLIGQFRDRESSVEFLCTVNHFVRGDAGARRRQAAGLRLWLLESNQVPEATPT